MTKTILLLAMGMTLNACAPAMLDYMFDKMDGGCRNFNSCTSGTGYVPRWFTNLPPPPPTYVIIY